MGFLLAWEDHVLWGFLDLFRYCSSWGRGEILARQVFLRLLQTKGLHDRSCVLGSFGVLFLCNLGLEWCYDDFMTYLNYKDDMINRFLVNLRVWPCKNRPVNNPPTDPQSLADMYPVISLVRWLPPSSHLYLEIF